MLLLSHPFFLLKEREKELTSCPHLTAHGHLWCGQCMAAFAPCKGRGRNSKLYLLCRLLLQQWAIADPCAKLLAGESYQVGQALEVFQCYLPATSTQSHGEGSTGGKGAMLLCNECLQCSINHCLLSPFLGPSQDFSFLMQEFPSSLSMSVNCWFSDFIFLGSVPGTKCHFWHPQELNTAASSQRTNQSPGCPCAGSVWAPFLHC